VNISQLKLGSDKFDEEDDDDDDDDDNNNNNNNNNCTLLCCHPSTAYLRIGKKWASIMDSS